MHLRRWWTRKLFTLARRQNVALAVERLEERTVPSLFGPPANTQVGAFPEGIASGDLDGANQNGNSVSVLLNDGNGNFPMVSQTIPGVATPEGIVIADFNGDNLR